MGGPVKRSPSTLLLVEWADSCILYSKWTPLEDVERDPTPVRIQTVGWVLRRTRKTLVLVQNVGGIEGEGRPQICGAIAIPRGAIIKETVLRK